MKSPTQNGTATEYSDIQMSTNTPKANTYKIAQNRCINCHFKVVEQAWCFILKYQQLGVIK